MRRSMDATIAAVAALACALSLWIAWPGIVAYDTTTQYRQAMTGRYDDWHPPIMARLWAGLEAIGLHGPAPMLVLQLVLLWTGLALLAIALARTGARRAGPAVLLIGLFPIVLGWMTVVLKDAELVAALALATGLVGWFRLRARPMPRWAVALVAVLLGYAMLVRANSAFAAVPLAWSWIGWAGLRRWWARGLLALASLALVFAVSGPINHRLLGAEPSTVADTLPIFDLAGITHYAGLPAIPGVPVAQGTAAVRKACYTPFYWDPLGDATKCGDIGDTLTADPHALVRIWIGSIAAHPLAYVMHRIAHLNANWRILVPADETSAVAPAFSSANPYHIGAPGSAATWTLAKWTTALARTPLGSPFAWLVLAGGLCWIFAATPRQPARDMGLALALSVCCMTLSFAVVSIACDLRYHLWAIVATALAAAMLGACEGVPGRRVWVVVAGLGGVCVVEIVARMALVAIPM